MKKIVSAALVFAMALSIACGCGMTASAAGAKFQYKILKNGTVQITRYSGNAENLVIPSQIDGYKVTAIGDGAFNTLYELKNVTIPDGVTTIGNQAFLACLSLENITLPNGIVSIGNEAFYGCCDLKAIDIPASVKTIGSLALPQSYYMRIAVDEQNESYCVVDGVLFNKSKTRLIKYGYNSMETYYSVPKGVTKIEDEALSSRYDLRRVDIPGSVKSIGVRAFSGCRYLEQVNIAYGVETIRNYAFADCNSLNKLVVPSSVKRLGRAIAPYSAIVYYNGTYSQWLKVKCGKEFYISLYKKPSNGFGLYYNKTVLYKSGKRIVGTKTVRFKGKTYAIKGSAVCLGKQRHKVTLKDVSYIVNKNGVVQTSGKARYKLYTVKGKKYIVSKKGVVQKSKKSIRIGGNTYKTGKGGVAIRK